MVPFTAGSVAQQLFLLSAPFLYLLLGTVLDVAVVAGFVALQSRDLIWQHLNVAWIGQTGLLLSSTLAIFWVLRLLLSTRASRMTSDFGKVVMLPCRTTHSRLFPKRHSFSYSYLVVGIPVGWEGNAGGMVSVGNHMSPEMASWFPPKPVPQKGWYDVDASDYLERGNGHLGLRGKLNAYLESQVSSTGTFLGCPLTFQRAGCGSFKIPTRLPSYRGEVSRLSFQPRLVLVPVRCGQGSCRHGP